MHLKQFSRLFSTTRFIAAAEKSPLGTLRKQTGYSFSNCKKALELNNNDVAKVYFQICFLLLQSHDYINSWCILKRLNNG